MAFGILTLEKKLFEQNSTAEDILNRMFDFMGFPLYELKTSVMKKLSVGKIKMVVFTPLFAASCNSDQYLSCL